MIPFEKTVHYIWVGPNPIPEEYLANMEATKTLNPDYEFKLWKDEDFLEHFPEISKRYTSATIFHKLQLARYFFIDTFGGIYTDFDVKWKVDFNTVFNQFDTNTPCVFVQRDDISKYTPEGEVLPHYDDFVMASKVGKIKSFIDFADKHVDRHITNKFLNIEVFSFILLTTWCKWQDGISFLACKDVGTDEDCTFAVHTNQLTWRS